MIQSFPFYTEEGISLNHLHVPLCYDAKHVIQLSAYIIEVNLINYLFFINVIISSSSSI